MAADNLDKMSVAASSLSPCAGATEAQGFTSYHMADFDVTPYHNQEFRWVAMALKQLTPNFPFRLMYVYKSIIFGCVFGCRCSPAGLSSSSRITSWESGRHGTLCQP